MIGWLGELLEFAFVTCCGVGAPFARVSTEVSAVIAINTTAEIGREKIIVTFIDMIRMGMLT